MNIQDKIAELKAKGFMVWESQPIAWWDADIYTKPEVAAIYRADTVWNKWTEECIDAAEILPRDIVADIGCGTGISTQKILQKNPAAVYAVEPAEAMLAIFRGNISDDRVKIIQGSIDELASSNLPKANKIISTGVLVAVKDKQSFLESIYAYLPQGGVYAFTVEDWQSSVGGISRQQTEIELAEFVHVQTGYKMSVHLPGQMPVCDIRSIEQMIKHAGGTVFAHSRKEISKNGEDEARAYSGLYSQDMMSAVRKFFSQKKIVEMTQHLFITTKTAYQYDKNK